MITQAMLLRLKIPIACDLYSHDKGNVKASEIVMIADLFGALIRMCFAQLCLLTRAWNYFHDIFSFYFLWTL